ncbi:GNAT family N-acetyltransferase [Wenyingzhuangia sp. 1_MG-2023]|nr:GNAT family N-acetyltransferase [Wenyingzhuangia sp. 1_MG-2023]
MNIKIVEFSKMTTLELFDCLKLRSDVFVVEQNCVYPDIDFIDKLSNHLLAFEDGELVGYLRIYTDSKNVVKIGRILIAEKHRGLGYAKEIISKAINFINNSKSNRIVKISAQEHLTGFYQLFGFKETGSPYLDYGINHVDMQLDL